MRDVDVTEVDSTWPTVTSTVGANFTTENEEGKGVYADWGTKVYKDRVIGKDVDGNDFSPLGNQFMRARSHWDVADFTPAAAANVSYKIEGRRRRGKLLPYISRKYSIGMSSNPESKLIGSLLDDETSIVILNQGAGYSEDDRFTTTYGTGKDLLLKPILDDTSYKGVKGFELVNGNLTHLHDGTDFTMPVRGAKVTKWGNGSDYSAGDFISYDKIHDGDDFLKVSADTKSSLRIVPIQTTGNGDLEAYFIRGSVVASNFIDEKPVLVKGATRLTEIPPRATTGAGGTAEETLQVLSSSKLNQIGTNGISPDSRYDIFFFFQNEISHTMSDVNLASLGNPKANEQYVNVSISFA